MKPWSLTVLSQSFFFLFKGINNSIIFHASPALRSYKIFEISCLRYINFSLFLCVHDIYMIFVHRVLSYTEWVLFSEQIDLISNWSLGKRGGWTQSCSLNYQKAAVCQSSSVQILLQIFNACCKQKQSNSYWFSSLFSSETYKTMWFCLYFLNQAGGEFLSILDVAWALCCLIWLIIKISVKLHGNVVLTHSCQGLCSPDGSSSGKETGASRQMGCSMSCAGWFILCRRTHEEQRCPFPMTGFKTST